MSSGLWEFNAEGAMSKHLHTGHAASSGVRAAELAARGFTGASAIVEGPRGFFPMRDFETYTWPDAPPFDRGTSLEDYLESL